MQLEMSPYYLRAHLPRGTMSSLGSCVARHPCYGCALTTCNNEFASYAKDVLYAGAEMLYSLDRMQEVKTIPHEREYRRWCSRLSDVQIRAITDELNRKIDKSGIHTSSWMPGSNWGGTVFQPIWETACQKNQDAAAKCFGLFLWEVMMNRPEDWAFGRYKLNEVPIEGLTYFRVNL